MKAVFVAALDHPEPLVRANMAGRLWSLGLDAQATRTYVSKLARDADAEVREVILQSIAGRVHWPAAEDDDREYLRLIDEASSDADRRLRAIAAGSLAHRDLDSDEVFEQAKRLLADPEQNVRDAAVRSLMEPRAVSGPSPSPDSYGASLAAMPPQPQDGLPGGSRPRMPPPPRINKDLPARYAELLLELRSEKVQTYLIRTSSLDASRLWAMIEHELKRPTDVTKERRMRLLFLCLLSDEPINPGYRYELDQSEEAELRDRIRPEAEVARRRLVAWANEAVRSEDEAMALSGAEVLEATAKNDPDQLTPLLDHPSKQVQLSALRKLVRK
jgi:hypothetical protein